jgi:hypothetical protein
MPASDVHEGLGYRVQVKIKRRNAGIIAWLDG